MKKLKQKYKTIIVLIVLLSANLGYLFDLIKLSNPSPSRLGAQEPESAKMRSSDNLNLLHFYDFEDNIVGEDPFGPTLWIQEIPEIGSIEIDNLGDTPGGLQQNHVLIHKIDDFLGRRLIVRDKVSIDGFTHQKGEIHFKMMVTGYDAEFEVYVATGNGENILGLMFNRGLIIGPNDITYYPLNQWYEVVIYFDLSIGWMIDFGGVRYGGDYSFEFYKEPTEGVAWVYYASIPWGGGSGYARFDDIAFYCYDRPLIIKSPLEGKSYYKGMTGYFPATFGFENTEIGSLPQGWSFFTNDPSENAQAHVTEEKSGHKKVLKFQHGGTPSTYSNIISPKISSWGYRTGIVEWWQFYEGLGFHASSVYLDGEKTSARILIKLNGDGSVSYYNHYTPHTVTGYAKNKWHHFKVIFDCWDEIYDLYINGHLIDSNINFYNYNLNELDRILRWRVESINEDSSVSYFDAIGFDESYIDWGGDYNYGDNLREGLLLDIEPDNWDYLAYRLDNEPSKIILGDFVIPLPEKGPHSLKISARDSDDNIYSSQISFSVISFLHHYDFEQEKLYQNPASPSLKTIEPEGFDWERYIRIEDEPSGSNAGNKFVMIHQSAVDQSHIALIDDLKIHGHSLYEGEIHCNVSHNPNGGWGKGYFSIVVYDQEDHEVIRLDYWRDYIGDYKTKEIYITYRFGHWRQLSIYFNISKGWMFDYRGKRYGEGYSFPFSCENPEKIAKISWGSNPYSEGIMRVDDILVLTAEKKLSEIVIKDLSIDGFQHPHVNGAFTMKDADTLKDNLITISYIIENPNLFPVTIAQKLALNEFDNEGNYVPSIVDCVDSDWYFHEIKQITIQARSQKKISWRVQINDNGRIIIDPDLAIKWCTESLVEAVIGLVTELLDIEYVNVISYKEAFEAFLNAEGLVLYNFQDLSFESNPPNKVFVKWEFSPNIRLHFVPLAPRILAAGKILFDRIFANFLTDIGTKVFDIGLKAANPYVIAAGLAMLTQQLLLIIEGYIMSFILNFADPHDENYTEVFVPQYNDYYEFYQGNSTFSRITSNSIINTLKYKADIEMFNVTLNRKNTALSVGDLGAALRQSEALSDCYNELKKDLTMIEEYRKEFLFELQKFNESYSLITQENLQKGKDLLINQGQLPEEEINLLKKFEFTDDEITAIYQNCITMDIQDIPSLEEEIIATSRYYSEINNIFVNLEKESIKESIELDIVVNNKEIINATQEDSYLMSYYYELICENYKLENYDLVITYSDYLIKLTKNVLNYTKNLEYLIYIDFALNKTFLANSKIIFNAHILSEPLSTRRIEEKIVEVLITNTAEEDGVYEIEISGFPEEWVIIYDKLLRIPARSSQKMKINLTVLGNYEGNYLFNITITSLNTNQHRILTGSIQVLDPILHILNEINQEMIKLEELISLKLARWRKLFCEKLHFLAEDIFLKAISAYISNFELNRLYLHGVKLIICLISCIAKEFEIQEQCHKITDLLNQVKEYY